MGEPVAWVPGDPIPYDAIEHIEAGGIVRAWNLGGFDWPMWNLHMVPLGWPRIDLAQCRDTMAEAQRQGLPGSLAGCGGALGLPDEWLKSPRGKALVRRCCMPGKKPPTQAELEELIHTYCPQDVRAERAIAQRVSRLSDYELKLWQLTVIINQRGIAADVKAAAALLKELEPLEHAANLRLEQLTEGRIDKVTQRQRIYDYVAPILKEHGYWLADLTRESLTLALADPDLPEDIQEILRIRRDWTRTSLAKCRAVIATGSTLHDHLRYAGAHTLRWSTGGAVQLQNLPRPPGGFDQDATLAAFKASRISAIPALADKDGFPLTDDKGRVRRPPPPEAASYAIRGLLVPRPGRRLVRGDFSAVEAIGTGWVSGCETLVEAFRQRRDVYSELAAVIFGRPINRHDDPDERQVGKITVLGCGFMLGAHGLLHQLPEGSSLPLAATCVDAYRSTYEEVPRFAYNLASTILETVTDGHPRKIGPIWVRLHRTPAGRWLLLGMPNRGWRWYFEPRAEKIDMGWGPRWMVSIYGMKAIAGGGRFWGRYHPHPGHWIENVVQSFCRDLVADAALDTEADPLLDVVHLVHDEIVAEGDGEIDKPSESDPLALRLQAHMERPREWLPGFPIRAECIALPRYAK